jgi:gamma-butyrobetaine dioxygenase
MNTFAEDQDIIDFRQCKNSLTLRWSDGFESSFHYVWLRENCRSSIDSDSGQRSFDISQCSSNIIPKHVEVNQKKHLEILWSHDNHHSTFESGWLRQQSNVDGKLDARLNPILWDGSFDTETCFIDYRELDDDITVLAWLENFLRYGFARLRNVPNEPKKILEIGEKISYIYQTLDGSYFLVGGNQGKSDYIAYSNKALGMHTDFPYFDPAPNVQLQHCLRNETSGGESLLVDGFMIASALKKKCPEQFEILANTPVKFRWKTCEKFVPIIQADLQGIPVQISYANHSFQPLRLEMNEMEAYYEAYLSFKEMLNSEEFRVEFRLQSGDISIIDNYRLLHGRNTFSTSGARQLSVCYIGRDGISSHINYLKSKSA